MASRADPGPRVEHGAFHLPVLRYAALDLRPTTPAYRRPTACRTSRSSACQYGRRWRRPTGPHGPKCTAGDGPACGGGMEEVVRSVGRRSRCNANGTNVKKMWAKARQDFVCQYNDASCQRSPRPPRVRSRHSGRATWTWTAVGLPRREVLLKRLPRGDFPAVLRVSAASLHAEAVNAPCRKSFGRLDLEYADPVRRVRSAETRDCADVHRATLSTLPLSPLAGKF